MNKNILSLAGLFEESLGRLLDIQKLDTMFQDSEGTIPVTSPGQSVGLIKDQSGHGNNYALSQPMIIRKDKVGYFLDVEPESDETEQSVIFNFDRRAI